MPPTGLPPTFQETDLKYYLRMMRTSFSELEEMRPQKLPSPSQIKNIVIVLESESMGRGKEMLGKKLTYHLLQSLINSNTKPKAIILLNSAVLLCQGKGEAHSKLLVLEEQGCKIMACISSAEEYGIMEQIGVGFVASMDEITDTLLNAWKVITL